MAHLQQQEFCESIKARFPQFFTGVMVLDIGSLDINGNNQYLFDVESLYLGIDVAQGRNVDVISAAHLLALPDATFDIIVSTECLEHDRHWMQTLNNAVRMLRPGGVMLITCATTGRAEHGTRRTTPGDAPLLASVDEEWADYYCNLDENDIRAAIDIPGTFQFSEFSIGVETHDLYFFGIKHGVFERRLNRSPQLRQSVLLNKLNDLDQAVIERDKQIVEFSQVVTERDRQIAELNQILTERDRQVDELNQVVSEHDRLLTVLYQSKSWRATHPLRVFMTQVGRIHAFTRRARAAFRYVARGDFKGLYSRLRSIQVEQALQNYAVTGPPLRWGIITTPHTLFVAHLIASRLRSHGWEVDILTSAPRRFPHDMYIVICSQMFKKLPPGEKRIVYQMEQSVSSRWFTDNYINILNSSLAVLEYALVNLEFLANKQVVYPHVHYLPVGADPDYMGHVSSTDKNCDVLFYGDSNSSPRRRKMLDALQRNFNVHISRELFGHDMINVIRRARIVINLHYYENALLEMPRIQECLSLGIPVVSESAQDLTDYPEIFDAVIFFEPGNEQAMLDAVRSALMQPVAPEIVRQAAVRSSERFVFMLDRFLVAMGFLSIDKLADNILPLPHDVSRIALSMPEAIFRRRVFEANRPQYCAVFDGVRLRPGWVGCGLSYANLARHAIQHEIKRLTILEDDVLLPDKFEEKMNIVQSYLDTKHDQWDVFSGVIAVLHEKAKILHVETFQGMCFVTLDKMTSMVCNIYNEKALHNLMAWNPHHIDDQANTIDKYLEKQANLRVIVTLPFLVGHREEVHSTLWGFQNTQYSGLITASELLLQKKVQEYLSRSAGEREE
ncbi:glycosyltransferase family protein [Nitrosomonas supralitoralis]|uniref:Uncharacterized protein n=1 Tax=Nitrosomonas supralitoralis TaxID=2116706 RepID=A0A2P7NZC5_9PROT|nr:methyltransferase domain-containing protein [Nitrosomonas supralitoralis]PSJ18810.1 hypothetical protein C7H79_00865 [Nitrosomonas supralitoralis]